MQVQSPFKDQAIKLIGLSILTLGLNYLLSKSQQHKQQNCKHKEVHNKKMIKAKEQAYNQWGHKIDEYNQNWGSLKILDQQVEDGLMTELDLMTRAMCDLERVNNLIVDLQLSEVKTVPCPLIAYQPKRTKDEPYLQVEAIVKPGTFLIRNCVFRSGQDMGNEKKFMRAGPRNTQLFRPSQVNADVVVLGKLCPGTNTIIRQLTVMLKNVYKVNKVYGVKHSFQGYYDFEKDQSSIIELDPRKIQTIHHHGGCYLGLRKTQFDQVKIVDNLQKRGINQVYLVGAYSTCKSAAKIYEEIKRRKLSIAICVLLKAINKDVALFDTCFGFQSAVQQTQKYIEMSYVSAKASHNTVALIKVPGWESGFLACDAAKAARNVNICLVPQFPFCFYGQKGLLKYICERIKHRGSCVIIYAEGACNAVTDIDQQNKRKQIFDIFFQKQIKKQLDAQNYSPNDVIHMDTNHAVRSIPANSLDTKLCSQVAHSSINCMMCGYTNFVCGHFGYKNAMVPIPEMMQKENKFMIKPEDEDWQRLLATTGQPSFLNQQ